MVNDYAGLKPGLYLQTPGGNIKNLSLASTVGWENVEGFGSGKTQGVEKLAAEVSWVYVAMNERRESIAEVPMFWTRDGENEADMVLGFDPEVELPRIDQAIQMYGQAFYFKQATRGMGVRLLWLDPATIEPDTQTIDDVERQFTNYWRSIGGKRIPIPADKILRVWAPRMREILPGTTAAQATSLAAQVAHNIDRTMDAFFETNALPPLLISVEGGLDESQTNRIVDFMKRIFNRRTDFGEGHKTIGVSGNVSVTKLSFAPDELDTAQLSESRREAILAGHGVPAALVYKDVNMAEAREKRAMFMARIVGRVDFLMRQINQDPDVMRSGAHLMTAAQQMEVFQRSELEKAEALQRLTGVPVLTINEARERLELDPVPGGDVIAVDYGGGRQPDGAPDTVEDEAIAEPTLAKSVKAEAEAQKFRRWLDKHQGDDPADFITHHMTAEHKAAVLAEWGQLEQVRLHGQFAEALARFNGAMVDNA